MEDEYISFYETYRPLYGARTVIFMMVGSFYELYDILDPHTGLGKTSCKDAVDTMGIILTTKKTDTRSLLFAGFPDYALHKWAGRLTSLGWTVVVVDQVKDTQGRVTQRKATSILSPGTHIEAASTDAVYLGGLFIQHQEEKAPAFGAAAIDLTTGKTVSFEGAAQGRQDEWLSDTLMHFFQVHSPKELVVWYNGPSPFKPDESAIRRVISLHPNSSILIREPLKKLDNTQLFQRVFMPANSWHTMDLAGSTGQIQSKPHTMLPIMTWLGFKNPEQSSATALAHLISFVEDHLPSSLDILHSHFTWKPSEHVYIGNNAFQQLQFTSGRLDESVIGIFNRALTPMGKRAVRERLLIPITNASILKERYDLIECVQELTGQIKKDLESALRLMFDIPRLHRKIQCIQPAAADILALYQSYESAKELSKIHLPIRDRPGPMMLASLTQNVAAHFSIEKAQKAGDELFFLNDTIAPQTAALEKELAALQKEVDDLALKMCTWAGLKQGSLALEWRETMCGFRASKTALATIKSKIPIHETLCPLKDMSINVQKSGGWIEAPFFLKHFNRVMSCRSKLRKAFAEELPVACMKFAEATMDNWDALEEWICEIDMAYCFATVARERGFKRPNIDASVQSHLDIRGLRHPLIESIQNRAEYVKHDVSLDDSCKGWLVYGMNASGKSSLMKAVGIAVLLAQTGSFVPATYMSFSPFYSVLTRILNQDNLWAGLSSFTVEMSELREILRRADAGSLVLGDELCSGTESVSATALVAAGIQTLLKKKARFLFATHFHGLTDVFKELPEGLAVWHLRVRYDPATEKLVYERHLEPGPGSTLYGLEVARALDLPADFMELAVSYRRGLVGSASDAAAPASRWNRVIRRRFCEVCGHEAVRDLEVHHIRERNEAGAGGYFDDGSHMNHVRNLVVLCEECHDKHHRGELEVGPMRQTSQGLQREVRRIRIAPTSEEDEEGVPGDRPEDIAKQYLMEHPTMPLKTVVFFLKQKGVTMTIQKISAIKKKL